MKQKMLPAQNVKPILFQSYSFLLQLPQKVIIMKL